MYIRNEICTAGVDTSNVGIPFEWNDVNVERFLFPGRSLTFRRHKSNTRFTFPHFGQPYLYLIGTRISERLCCPLGAFTSPSFVIIINKYTITIAWLSVAILCN